MSSIRIYHPTGKVKAHLKVPGSKSESNRLLILQALSGNKWKIENLSSARDTQNLLQILASGLKHVNVMDAGTSMRFLTAYYAATNQPIHLTGSSRMQERPIAPLVHALSEMGFDIRYAGQEGFPPLEIVPVQNLKGIDDEVYIAGNISSQFITALLLIAPFLSKGLTIHFTTSLVSRSYIEMTTQMLQYFGVNVDWKEDSIHIPNSKLEQKDYAVGGDWSSAAYWYSVAFLAKEAEIFLEGMKDDWNQGDREVADWMKRFGITTEFDSAGATLRKVEVSYPKMMKLNFRDNPDLAQTFAAMFAVKNIYATFSGIDSLKIKETDRIAALQTELLKMNVHFDYSDFYDFYQIKGEFHLPAKPIATYNDHRMAMSFAPLALLGEIEIEHPNVVEKSYPGFWNDLEKAGFVIQQPGA